MKRLLAEWVSDILVWRKGSLRKRTWSYVAFLCFPSAGWQSAQQLEAAIMPESVPLWPEEARWYPLDNTYWEDTLPSERRPARHVYWHTIEKYCQGPEYEQELD